MYYIWGNISGSKLRKLCWPGTDCILAYLLFALSQLIEKYTPYFILCKVPNSRFYSSQRLYKIGKFELHQSKVFPVCKVLQ